MEIGMPSGSGNLSGRLVEIAGDDPRDRGRQYGEQAAGQIERSISYYADLFAHDYQMTWPEIARRALAWEAVTTRFAPDLAEEVYGIAEGACRSPGEIMALNARGEMVYGNYVPAAPEGCTSYAMLPETTRDGHMYCGQNWDWRFGAAETWIVLRVVQPPKPTVVTVVEAGQVGRHGANSAGMAVLANGLGGFCAPEPGVPQPFIRRRLLDTWSFSEALDVALSAQQQIAANLMLVHRDGFALDLETTPECRAWLYPAHGMLVHGNHYEAFSWARDGCQYRPCGADSLYRVWRLKEGLGACREVGNREELLGTVAAALCDHFGFPASVCTHPDERDHPLQQWQTLTSSIIDLTAGDWRLAPGVPCTHGYEQLPWNLYE